MRVLGAQLLIAYAKRKPRIRGFLLAFRAFVEASSWKRMKDVEGQFTSVAIFTPPDRIALDFPDEGVRIEMRMNCALGLARVYSVGPSAGKREGQK